MLSIPAVIVCLAATPLAAQNPAIPPGTSEIATTGRGEVRVTPDHAILMVSVESRAASAAAAASENAGKIASAIAALRAAGVTPEQITTVGYSVAQDYDIGPTSRRPNGFLARNGLRIEVRRIADIGKFIDAALSGGATQVSPAQFLAPNPADARQRALALAVAEARRDAETLAKAAGGSLGRLIYLTSSGYPSPPAYTEQMAFDFSMSRVAGGSTMVTPNDLTITAIASARWQFVPPSNP